MATTHASTNRWDRIQRGFQTKLQSSGGLPFLGGGGEAMISPFSLRRVTAQAGVSPVAGGVVSWRVGGTPRGYRRPSQGPNQAVGSW